MRYCCRGALINQGSGRCISFGSMRVDEAVSRAVAEVLTPLGMDAAVRAVAEKGKEHLDVIRQKELALEQAQYEAARAGRQYHTVDPENRLVASELERRWNETLLKVEELNNEIKSLKEATPEKLSSEEEARIYKLGCDLQALWNDPSGDVGLKKRILRILLVEIIAKVNDSSDMVHLVLHWQGGDHTQIVTAKNRSGSHRCGTNKDTIELIRNLARCLPDKLIAALLNRLGRKTGKGHNWTQGRVCSARDTHNIIAYREGERLSRGEMTMLEAAKYLKIGSYSMRQLIVRGLIPSKQICQGAPWIIKKDDLEKPEVQQLLDQVRHRQDLSPSRNYELPLE